MASKKEKILSLTDPGADDKLRELGMTYDELLAIEEDFAKKIPQLDQAATYITNTLLKTSGVHSVRSRIKNPGHLSEKIFRKRQENPKRIITLNNYETEITDLVGVRIIHLFKNDWNRIHKFIINTWKLHEKPTAYYRGGDSSSYLEMFKKMNCRVKPHDAGYRSVHYIIEIAPTNKRILIEVQVRTIFEEGWSEVDHKFRYPKASSNPLTDELLLMLNRLAGSADEMSSFVQVLNAHLRSNGLKFDRLAYEKDKQIKELQDKINSLEISTKDKQELNNLADKIQNNSDTKTTSFKQSATNTTVNKVTFDAYPDWAFISPMQEVANKLSELVKPYQPLMDAINNTRNIYQINSPLIEAAAKASKIINAANNPAIEAMNKFPKIPKTPGLK